MSEPYMDQTGVVITTAAITFITGFVVGIYSTRGYLITPGFAAERRRNLAVEAESDEEDVDEDDTILDHAPNWANGEEADRRDGLRMRKGGMAASGSASGSKSAKTTGTGASTGSPVAAGLDTNEECKLVLVVRTDLGMTKGKIAAQCSHATLACYKTLLRASQRDPSCQEAKILKQWERRGQAKIAVQVKSQDELMELLGVARSLGITSEVIQDAGRTQIEAGSFTVLGVGPAPKSAVDKVTGSLKLL